MKTPRPSELWINAVTAAYQVVKARGERVITAWDISNVLDNWAVRHRALFNQATAWNTCAHFYTKGAVAWTIRRRYIPGLRFGMVNKGQRGIVEIAAKGDTRNQTQ